MRTSSSHQRNESLEGEEALLAFRHAREDKWSEVQTEGKDAKLPNPVAPTEAEEAAR